MFVKEQCFEETSIGKYPKDWEVAVLGEVARVKGGKRLPKGEKLADYDTGFPYIRVVDFSKGTVDKSNLKYLLPETRKTIKNYTISSNDVYVSIAGTIGLAGVIPPELDGANLTENAAKICDLQNIEKRFLAYLFDAEVMKKQIAGLMGKGTQPKLALFRIESLKFPCPSMEEQRAIVKVLSAVDCAIELADRIIAQTERLKRGLMQHLLTRGIGHKETKQTPIGTIPKTWQVVKLKDIVKIDEESRDPSREIPGKAFNYIDIESVEGGTGKIRNPKIILGKDAPSRARRVVHENDVIMSTVRPYLKAFAIVPKEYDNAICSTGFAVLTSRNSILPSFLLNVLFSNQTITQCNKMMVGGQYPALNQSQVSEIEVPLPPLPEQQHISEILSTVDCKLELERAEKIRLERIKRGLMDLLLTGKVRIKVD